MPGDIGSYISGLLGKLKDAPFPLFACSGAFLLFGADIAVFVELEGGKLPSGYLLAAWAVLFMSGAALVQKPAGALSRGIEIARRESQKRKDIETRKRQRLENLNSLNKPEAEALYRCLLNNERTFYRTQSDLAAMSLLSKGIVERTHEDMLSMPFTISTDVWSHLMEDKEKWLKTFSEKCPPKRPSRRR